MSYDRISPSNSTANDTRRHLRFCSTRIFLFTLTLFLLFASAINLVPRTNGHRPSRKLTGQAGERDLLHISLNMTLHRVGAALYGASAMASTPMDPRIRVAYEDCIELLDDSVDQLSQSILAVSHGAHAHDDVVTWLSAALTNHDTCSEGLDGIPDGYVKQQMAVHLKDLAELVSNCLAIFSAASSSQDFAGVPIENRRKRRLLSVDDTFPKWVKPKDRRLLQMLPPIVQADFIVSKDGNGTHKTIEDAVKAAPEGSYRRIIIYIKAGRYDENIKVSRKKINIMFVGDGKGKTVVAGSRSIYDNFTTFHTATFAATGAGFIMKDMTIENWAGPYKHQAVALRVGADHAVVYRCSIIGYQDTLYVHSQRQFFRECDIYGTVDFIFGNAAVVFQKCAKSAVWARKPLTMQKITITAQNRKDPNQNTGISIHDCQILPASDLNASAGNMSSQTFLGRPWKLYSRVVYLLSYMGGHIEPRGWLEWNQTFALDTLYYGEYMNYGPGAAVGKRVQWPGYKVITLPEEAGKFTVANFIFGSSWLPSTGVAFLGGLLY
ncbi:LOW QUALITY PROTEIN: probable pectinesterase/pectinesterase inhibitor 34 [Phalaenopsis equestris]|uniref:LOW QUALITY PROTEIN: probable pectinesterase/pectinesterase inhibitor 34 n=1 Tax=Phalaenopsis equestris TaxID=78828 RepID=UPI0009E3F33E|nr:LOW QUALITY PROTEIN: probable pectinesterase/pectinesterase inhibitor 34 [Phalaenopsis equestris]